MSISESPSQLIETDYTEDVSIESIVSPGDTDYTEDVSIEPIASPDGEQLNPDDSHPHDDPLYTSTGPCLTDPKDFDKIYDGSAVSICAFNCSVMKFAIKHSLNIQGN